MFAVRFWAVASLVTAVPFATAAEPHALGGRQFSFAPPASQPTSLTFSAANTHVLGQNSLTIAPWAGSTLLPPTSSRLAGLSSIYVPTGTHGSGATSSLLSASPRSFLTSSIIAPVQPNWQSLLTPNTAVRGPSPWPTTRSTSLSPFVQPSNYGGYSTFSR